jgi:cytoskeletal protein RodZ
MPESLGKILKRIRESKRLSIEEASEKSRISKSTISIIEEDRLSEMKSGFYAKIFVKTYAAFLGAMNESGVKEYLADMVSKPASKPAQEIKQKNKSSLDKFPYKNQIIAGLAVIFVLWALFAAAGWAVKVIKKRAIPKKVETKKSADIAKDAKKEVFDVKYDSIELEVSASDNTLLQVTADREMVFKGVFKKGSKDTWKAKKEIKLEAGNSGAIKISINGKPSGFSGKKGEKKEIVITRDGIK